MPPLLQHGAWAGAAWAPAVAHQACACRAPAPRQEPCCNGQGSPGEPRAAQAARRSRRRGAGAARRGGGACAAEQGGSGILELVADRITVDVGGRQLTLETGEVGRQANGAVLVTDGETVVYTTACCSAEPTNDGSFTPLQVLYSERFSAAGKTRRAR